MATAHKRNGDAKPNFASATHNVRRDFQALRDDLGALAEQVTALAQETSEETLAEVKDRVRRMRDNVDQMVSDTSARGRDALRDISEDLNEAAQVSLREHPLTVLGLAMGIGFIFGATWRR
jgi:ElaB/YqjD/DUF883 family membrane-anchored ribosome-binding protein